MPTALNQNLRSHFVRNMRALGEKYGRERERERVALRANDYVTLHNIFEGMIEKADHNDGNLGEVYDLFTGRYGAIYFSIQQAMEIDSLRAAIDCARGDGSLSDDQARWLLLAAAMGMNRCTTSPGHFAQPVGPKRSNIARIVRDRSRSLVKQVRRNFRSLSPVGSKAWRARNQVFSADATSLLRGFNQSNLGVVYADPPYTDDQYSRYYHLYETLILYDYPSCSGRGRYRQGRWVSDFSLASKVGAALENLIKSAAELSADLILSYPANGLLERSTERIPELIKAHYGRGPTIRSISHTHSTMGGSKGAGATTQVTENIYKVAA